MVLMNNVDREEVLAAVRQLSEHLDREFPGSRTGDYVREYLDILTRNKNKGAMAFYGQMRYFAMTVQSYRADEHLKFRDETKELWYHMVNDFNQVGVLHWTSFL